MNKPQIFVDMDGVLSDFDKHYENLFGVCPNQDTYEPPDMWDNIRAFGDFYQSQPLMPGAIELWEGLLKFHSTPVILTGIPWSIPRVVQQKSRWRDRYFPGAGMICCPSKEKCKYGRRGDILIDDRLKYSKYWIDMGGKFVHHVSVSTTLAEVSALFALV